MGQLLGLDGVLFQIVNTLDFQPMKVIVGILLSLSLVLSCSKNDRAPGPIIRIDDDFNIIVWEDLQEASRDIQLVLTTNKALDCENYLIDYTTEISSSKIILEINGVIPPTICQGISGFPIDTISLGDLESGTYAFEILIGGEIHNLGTFEVSDSMIKSFFYTTNGFSVENENLSRIPYDLLWGTIHYNNGSSQVADSLLIDLLELDNGKAIPAGNYGYFSLANDEVSLPTENQSSNTKSFAFRTDVESSIIASLVNTYRANHPNEIQILVWNGKGTEF
ncbi:MAG: hypothetical protein R2784_05175 [Saprospiraceae bacterium]